MISDDEFKMFSQITIIFIVVTSVPSLLTSIEQYQLSFVIEIIGLSITLAYFMRLRSRYSIENSSKEMVGLSDHLISILIFVTLITSIPFWFSECFEIQSLTFYRRAFGTYSYSTLLKAPIFEEFYFRGVLFYFLIKRYGSDRAIWYNGLIFTAIHLQLAFVLFDWTLLVLLLVIFTFGVFLAYVQFKTNNLLFAMGLHFLANLMTILFGLPIEPIIANDAC